MMLMFATDGLTLIYSTSATPASSSHPPTCKSCSFTELLQPEVPVHLTTPARGQTDLGRKAATLMRQSQRSGTNLVSPEENKPLAQALLCTPVSAQCAWGHP